MSRSIFSNGGKRCLHKLLLERRSINGFCNGTHTVANQQARSFARSPLILKKLKHLGLSPSSSCSSSSSSPLFSSIYASFSSASSASSSVSAKNGFIGWYLGMIESHPILTKSVTSAAIYTVADLSSQMITGASPDSLDTVRTLRMAGYGMIIMGPSLHFWFNFVSKVLPKRDVFSTFKKIFMGQTVYGPIMTTCFFSVNAALQGESGAEIATRLKRDAIPTMLNGLMYWPICDFVTFKFIPVRLQPLVSNSFAYLWTIYITYMASLKQVEPSNVSAD